MGSAVVKGTIAILASETSPPNCRIGMYLHIRHLFCIAIVEGIDVIFV